MTFMRRKTQIVDEISISGPVGLILTTSWPFYYALAAISTNQPATPVSEIATPENQAPGVPTSRISGNGTEPAGKPLTPVPKSPPGNGTLVFASKTGDHRGKLKDSDPENNIRAQVLTPLLGGGTPKTTFGVLTQSTPCIIDFILSDYQTSPRSKQFFDITNAGITDPSSCFIIDAYGTNTYGTLAVVLNATGGVPSNSRNAASSTTPRGNLLPQGQVLQLDSGTPARLRYYNETLERFHTSDTVLGSIHGPSSLHLGVFQRSLSGN